MYVIDNDTITITIGDTEYFMPRNLVWKMNSDNYTTVYYITKSKSIIDYD